MVPGGLYLIPPHVDGDYHCPRAMDLGWIHVMPQLGHLDVFRTLDFRYELPPEDPALHGPLFGQLLEQARRPQSAARLGAESLAAWYLSRFLVPEVDRASEAGSSGRLRLAPVLAHLREHLDEAFELRELASLLHLHPTYFSNLFRSLMGMPPLAYLLQLRVEKAKELLWFSAATVADIARLVGFADPLYFSRQFRRLTGRSPRNYRRMREEGRGL